MQLLELVNRFVWGIPALILILGVGIYITVCCCAPQIRLFPKAISEFGKRFRKKDSGYQALCTALAATVGTGNVAGVAGAIAIGGPGAVFWMWVSAFLGMGTKYAEALLSVRYRCKNAAGETVGGPMYIIEKGLGVSWKPLAMVYCFLGIIAAFGVGNSTQINAVIDSVNSAITAFGGKVNERQNVLLGVLLAALIAAMLFGGASRIGKIAEQLVPFAAGVYILLGIGILIIKAQALPEAISAIFRGAFSPRAVTGGTIGSLWQCIQVGVSRGVFTNEAGMGTAAIAHGASDVHHPAEQGLMGIMEVFLDTIVICTITALVILSSGIPVTYGTDGGAALTTAAFTSVYGGWASVILAFALCCFALATILGWGLYGIRCAQYIFGENVWRKFVYLQVITVIFSTLLKTGTVWMLAETVNGLMAIPNLIALGILTPEVLRLTKNYIYGFRHIPNLTKVQK